MDYWLFDDELVVRLVYGEEGAVTRAEEARDSATLSRCREARDTALRLAVPLARYVAEHGINAERITR